MVRTAVATVESVFRMPHFAKIAVIPAKKAEPIASKTHMQLPPFKLLYHVNHCSYDRAICMNFQAVIEQIFSIEQKMQTAPNREPSAFFYN